MAVLQKVKQPRITLRPYQADAVARIREAWYAGKRKPLFVLPTGGGKTYTFAYIADKIRQNPGKRVYILVHRDNLLDQTHRSLNELGVPHGIIASGFTPIDHPVQVCSVYTLANRLADLPPPDLIIIDEAHHARAGTWQKILDYWHKSRVLGVTATPCRGDGSGLGVQSGGYFDAMVLGPSMIELTKLGNLCEYDYYLPPAGVDLSTVKTGQGEYNRKDLDKALRKPKITGCAVEHYLRICPKAPAIAFCVSIAHANDVAAQFRARGVSAQALTSEMTKDQIRSFITALGEGRIQVLTSCDIISEGTDIPIVTTAILLRPTHSLGLYLQQVGRVLRPAPGKGNAIILDHVNNIGRHGLPDADRDWKLDAPKKKARKGYNLEEEEAAPQTRQCDECYFVHRPQPTCPKCGFVYQNNRTLESIDGTLKKVSKDEIERLKREKRAERGRAQTLEDLEALEKERGYKPGWAKHVWRSRGQKSRR
jgi:superfamily II DNA or RNA helicase